jgi:hypothetical protein
MTEHVLSLRQIRRLVVSIPSGSFNIRMNLDHLETAVQSTLAPTKPLWLLTRNFCRRFKAQQTVELDCQECVSRLELGMVVQEEVFSGKPVFFSVSWFSDCELCACVRASGGSREGWTEITESI